MGDCKELLSNVETTLYVIPSADAGETKVCVKNPCASPEPSMNLSGPNLSFNSNLGTNCGSMANDPAETQMSQSSTLLKLGSVEIGPNQYRVKKTTINVSAEYTTSVHARTWEWKMNRQ